MCDADLFFYWLPVLSHLPSLVQANYNRIIRIRSKLTTCLDMFKCLMLSFLADTEGSASQLCDDVSESGFILVHFGQGENRVSVREEEKQRCQCTPLSRTGRISEDLRSEMHVFMIHMTISTGHINYCDIFAAALIIWAFQ